MFKKNKLAVLLTALLALPAFGQERGAPIFSDNFDTKDTFAENWTPGQGWNGRIKSEGGKVLFPQGGVLLMRRTTPPEFYAEADLTIHPDGFGKPIQERQSTFCGFRIEGFSFFLLPVGNTWMIWKLPGQEKARGKQVKIDGFEIGKPVRITLIRKVDKGFATYFFKVNGKDAGSFVCDAPVALPDVLGNESFKPLELFSSNLFLELDNFSLSSIKRSGDDSPNMVVNSSFEYDEDGIPPYYCRTGMFNFLKMGEVAYEDYLNSWRVDRTEKHSGNQSLKVVLDDSSAGDVHIWAHGAGTVKDAAGVFSVWMKSDREDLPVTIRYGIKKMVKVGKDWKRYEIVNPKLPGTGIYSPVGISVSVKEKGTLWIDDLQAEIIDLPKPEEGGVNLENKPETYATPYKPSGLDKTRFAKNVKPERAPGFTVPKLPAGTPPGVKLDDWKEKALKLDQFWFKGKKASRDTEAYLACDDGNLYLGFRNFGEDGKSVSLPAEKCDSFSAFNRDGLELFFAVTDAKKWHHLITTGNGLQTDLFGEDVQWNGNWKSKAVVNEAENSVDYFITIPFSDFAGPDLKSRWLMNFGRNDVHDTGRREYQSVANTPLVGYRQHDYWPIAELPEDIVKQWSSGAKSAATAVTADGVVYTFSMENAGEKRTVAAELIDTANGDASLGVREFVFNPGKSDLSFTSGVASRKVRLLLKEKDRVLSNQVFIPEKRNPVSMLGRLNFYMNEPEAVFKISLNLPDAEKLTAVLECAGRKVEAKAAPFFKMNLPLNGLSDGKHEVTVTLLRQDGSVAGSAKSELVKKPYWEGATQINHFSRSLVHKGKPLFMIGPFFGDFSFVNVFSGELCLKMLEFAEKYGFKTGHILVGGHRKGSVENGAEFLKAAAEHDFNVILWAKYGEPKAVMSDDEMMKTLESTNILSQMILDEPELGMPSDAARDFLRKMRSKFPYHPVHMNNTVLGIPNRYANLETDILMLDNYLTSVEKQKVKWVVDHADHMWNAGKEEGKPCYYFLVTTNFPLHYKEPSYREQIAQSYGAVAAGCTGISYYIGFPTTLGTWKAMIQMNKEILSLESVLLSEEDVSGSKCDGDPGLLRHLTKKHEGFLYVVSVNIDENPAGKVTFTLPSGYSYDGPVEVLFEDRKIELKNGQFSDEFGGHFRHVYKVKIR